MTEYPYVFKDQYDTKKEYPIYWRDISSDLRSSAGILWIAREAKMSEDILKPLGIENAGYTLGAWQTYEMLAGLSLELLFKSLCILNTKSFPEIHKLVDLAEMAKLDIADGEKTTLTFLTESVVWASKYPVPKHKKHFFEYKNLQHAHIFQSGTLSKMVQSENKIVGWNAFNGIWLKADNLFWKLSEEFGYL